MEEKQPPDFGTPDTLERPGFKDLAMLLMWLVGAAAVLVGIFAAAHYLGLPRLGGR